MGIPTAPLGVEFTADVGLIHNAVLTLSRAKKQSNPYGRPNIDLKFSSLFCRILLPCRGSGSPFPADGYALVMNWR